MESERRGETPPTIGVVLADDSELMRVSLSAVFERDPKLDVLSTAEDGVEAVRQAEDLAPDLVVLDFRMPGLNGFEAAKQIKERLPDTKVVIVSMHNLEPYRAQGETVGVDGLVSKRELRTELFPLIDRLFE